MRPMLAALLASALAIFASSGVFAQTGYFEGTTPRPADVWNLPASVTVTRSAPPGGSPVVIPTLYTHLTTDPESQNVRMGEPHDPQQPFQLRRKRRDVCAGQQVRARHVMGRRVRGPGLDRHRRLLRRRDRRVHARPERVPGIAARATASAWASSWAAPAMPDPKATIDYGILLAPTGLDDTQADVNFGVMVWSQCRYACYRDARGQQAGVGRVGADREQVRSRPPAAGDSSTATSHCSRSTSTTGELRVNGRPVQVTYKD